jgi:NTP pyrophosphatase (non-canonical NTP hydrolase)
MNNRKTILEAIDTERKRQEMLRAEGRFTYTCASPEMSNAERLTVLAEEYGEIAHEVNEGIGEGKEINLLALRKELVQTAAVAVSWIESYGLSREGALYRVEADLEEPDATVIGDTPTAAMRFAHLSYHHGQISNDVVLELAALLQHTDMIPNLATFAGACVQWLEAL